MVSSIQLSTRYTHVTGQPYVDTVELNTNFIAEWVGYEGMEEVWIKPPDMGESYPLLYPPDKGEFTIRVNTDGKLAFKAVNLYIPLTNAIIAAFATCRLRFEVNGNRVVVYMVNLKGKKRLIKS